MKRLSLAVLLLMSGMTLAADPKLVVWDGDEHKDGGGWGHGADKPSAVHSEGHSEKTSVRFVKDGPGWGGWGWNWHNWKPNAVDDVTGYTTFSFWARVTGSTKPTQMLVSLASNDGKHSQTVDALKYQPKLLDGEWVEVRIPMKDLLGEKPQLDVTKVFEVVFGESTPGPVRFCVFVDDIAFEKEGAAATTNPK
jgi:hypothetical protein